MNDPTPKSDPESPPRADKAHDTAGSGIGVTPPQPIVLVGPDDPLTVPSNHPNAPHPAAAVGPVGVGDYVIVRMIGEGGMGTVYLAEDTRLHRKAAIKTLQRELAANQVCRDRFEREARAAAAVEHDNIVPIWQVGEAADGTPFIAMPFLQGESLDARLARAPVAGVGLVLKVAHEVSRGLAAAHAKGLVHRDIKPANIWLEGDLTAAEPGEQVRRCKILDFGLVRNIGTENVQITTPGQSPGTPAFMSPEQARGEQVDHRSDLWSLGVTLYRMATGALPFNGPHAMAVLIALTTEPPPPVRALAPGLPPPLADLIDRLMTRAPAGRPQSAAEVAATARQIAKELQARKSAAVPPIPPPPPPVVVHSLPEVAPAAQSISESVPHLLPLSEELTEPDDAPSPATRAEAKRGRFPWVIAAAVGLLVLVPLVLWASGVIGGKKPEGDVAKNDDPPKPVTLPKKDGTPPKKEVPKDPDRTAAEYMLSIGNSVCINEEPREYKTRAELPPETFRLSYANLAANPNVTDAGLANFRGCKNLTEVYLMETPVTAAGLAHFKDSPGLHTLGLDKTPVTNAGLAHLAEMKNLKRLTLTQTQVTAQGVADLAKAIPLCDIQWDGNTGPKEADPDRKAALYVRSLGGCVFVDDQDKEIKADKPLPKGPFRLNAFQFLPDTVVTDAGLAAFAGCQNMVTLGLSDFPVGDAGLAHFKGCKGLLYVYLGNTRVTSAGLAALADCTEVMELNLSGTPVDDAALPVLKRFTKLNILDLKGTKVTAKGYAELRKALPGECDIQWDGKPTPKEIDPKDGTAIADRKAAEWVLSAKGSVQVNGGGDAIKDAKALPKDAFKLTDITLTAPPPIKDADLAVLAGCKNLTGAYLVGTGITNAGLAHLKDCTELKSLFLSGTKVDNGSVPVIKGFTKLRDLSVGLTDITEKGVQEIANALPGCRIQHNGGTIDPTRLSDRKAAEWVLSIGGRVCVNSDSDDITDAKKLPKEPFRLTRLDLHFKQVTDVGLANFAGCNGLTSLDLGSTRVGDAGLVHFKECKGLTELSLNDTEVTDAGLANFKECRGLKYLYLDSTKVGDAGLAHLKECQDLTYINLEGAPVTDAAILHLKLLKGLTTLNVKKSTMTAKGIDELKNELPKCKIEWDGGTIEPKEK